MLIKNIIAEDFVNYKLPSMFIVSAVCDFKCCKEAGIDVSVCLKAPLVSEKTIDIPDKDIYKMFTHNPISKAVVIGGLEPFLQFDEVDNLISYFRRRGSMCDFVIYTGYYPEEIIDQIGILSKHKRIFVKFGRYLPNDKPVYDEVLGVMLASHNQFAKRIS